MKLKGELPAENGVLVQVADHSCICLFAGSLRSHARTIRSQAFEELRKLRARLEVRDFIWRIEGEKVDSCRVD